MSRLDRHCIRSGLGIIEYRPQFIIDITEYCHLRGIEYENLNKRQKARIVAAFDEEIERGNHVELF